MKNIRVGLGTCGISAGGDLVFNKFRDEISLRNLSVRLDETGCMGMCYEEVLVEIIENENRYLYSKVTVDKVGKILNEHIINDRPITDWIIQSNGICKEES
ncbi:MAG: (2Fe-2S) ferredoxin domain-containing protein, partial [Melioribacteraceae bacterium]